VGWNREGVEGAVVGVAGRGGDGEMGFRGSRRVIVSDVVGEH